MKVLNFISRATLLSLTFIVHFYSNYFYKQLLEVALKQAVCETSSKVSKKPKSDICDSEHSTYTCTFFH